MTDRVTEIDKPSARIHMELSWGVFDLNTHETQVFDAAGGHFVSTTGHRFLVFCRASDPLGVRELNLDGSGIFEAATKPDKRGIFHTAVNRLPASIAHGHTSGEDSKTLIAVAAVMNPDIGAFDYSELSCGWHHYNYTSSSLEYFAINGLFTFTAAGTNSRGQHETASLTTSP
jgi:hypothetical protein